MKMVNQAGVGSSLAGSVDFDDFTAAGRGSGLCPSAKRAPGSKRNGSLAIPQPAQVRCRECRGIVTPVQFREWTGNDRAVDLAVLLQESHAYSQMVRIRH
jgi:hypothetical protein